jgi:hypothetical protein
MGTLSGIGHPLFLPPLNTATLQSPPGSRGAASLVRCYGVEEAVRQFRSPVWKRNGAISGHRFRVRDESVEAACQPWCRNLSSRRGCRKQPRGPSHRTGFANQKSEAPTLLWTISRNRHYRVVPRASRKRCINTRSSQRPNLCPTSLKWATHWNPRRS